jgi:hypothetical protein
VYLLCAAHNLVSFSTCSKVSSRMSDSENFGTDDAEEPMDCVTYTKYKPPRNAISFLRS